MEDRLRFLKAATAFLYFGPLMAGMAGHSLALVPIFTAIYVIWLWIMRPKEWPRDKTRWKESDTWVAATARVAVQLTLVLILFGIGRGMIGVAGFELDLPMIVPLIVSFVAIPISRLIWDPSDETRFGGIIDKSFSRLGLHATRAPSDDPEFANVMTGKLADLPADASATLLEKHLVAMSPHMTPDALLQSLITQGTAKGAALPLRRALVLRATDPTFALKEQAMCGPEAALRAARGNAGLLALYAPRAKTLLTGQPYVWPAFPSADEVRAAAQEVPEAGRALKALAADLDRIAPSNHRK